MTGQAEAFDKRPHRHRRVAAVTIDFHVAQNDRPSFGSGTHDKTGRHCLPTDPHGKLDSSATRGSGCATSTTARRALPAVCWTAACSERDDDAVEDVDNVLRLMGKRSAHGWDVRCGVGVGEVMKRKLNIGLVGYGFMGARIRMRSWQPALLRRPCEPVLKAVCARNADSRARICFELGYESTGDRLGKLVERRTSPHRHREPQRHARGDAVAARAPARLVMCESRWAQFGEAESMAAASTRRRWPTCLVQLSAGCQPFS